MTKLHPCPICGEEMKHETDYLDGYILCEEYLDCPQEHYSYEYTYGYSREFVGKNHTEYHTYSYHEDEYSLWMKLQMKLERLHCQLHINWLKQ